MFFLLTFINHLRNTPKFSLNQAVIQDNYVSDKGFLEKMGLAASSARLLSITSRLSDNELRSQTLTTAKMSLSGRTKEASAEYMDALNSTKLLYTTYDSKGNKMMEKLTGTSLSYYGELKNQYGLINKNNQILVSEVDAKNYEDSADMMEFLSKYGVLSEPGKGDIIQVVNPDWEVAWGEYEKEHAEWKTQEPDKSDEKYWDKTASTGKSIYDEFIATGGCLGGAVGGSCCYMHVLSDAIGPGTHTTSDGVTYEVTSGGSWAWNSAKHDRGTWDPITEELKNSNCSGDEIAGGSEVVEAPYGNVTVGGPPSDPNMTVYQRIVDLLWEVHGEYATGNATGGSARPESLAKFFYLIEHDLAQFKKGEDIFLEDLYNKDRGEWLEKEPGKPDVPYYIDKEIAKIVNKDKGQWYVNLWHRMNGPSQDKAGIPDKDGNLVEGGTTESGLPKYKVLEDGLMNSADYLQYALDNGSITLERVNFTDPTEEGTGLVDCTWTSIIWTNAADISEEENSAAITKAEVMYEQSLKEIEAKDKQYDNRLKLLDTEHGALQTEYDSVKGVIDKNIERTLKIYS